MSLPSVTFSTKTFLGVSWKFKAVTSIPYGTNFRSLLPPPSFRNGVAGIITVTEMPVEFGAIDWRLWGGILYQTIIEDYYDFPATRLSQLYQYQFNSNSSTLGKRDLSDIDAEIVQVSYEVTNDTSQTFFDKPNYVNLATGYILDNREFPSYPRIVPDKTTTVKVSYYANNGYEPIPKLTSIDWLVYNVDLVKGVPATLPINACVLGTLHLSDPAIKSKILALPNSADKYPWASLFPESLPTTFQDWRSLWNAHAVRVIPTNAINVRLTDESSRILKVMGANNDHWKNRPEPQHTQDVGYDRDHTMFRVNNERAYNWHIKPRFDFNQKDAGRGSLTMDSIRTIEIHEALDAAKWSKDTDVVNPNNPNAVKPPRVANLGWHINRQSEVLGIRVKADGTIDRAEEKAKYNPQILNNPQYAEGDYGVTCWGKYGMVIPRLITEYDSSGKIKQPYHVVYDIPQIFRAFQGDIDTALSLQHGTEIRTRDIDGNVGKYPNQLALMLDLHRRTQAIELYSQRSYNLNTVSTAEIRGLYGGLGIPVSQQFINATNLIGKTGVTRKLPYFSYQKGRETIASRFTTIEVNLGIILGTIMPKSQTEKQKILNPFKRFTA